MEGTADIDLSMISFHPWWRPPFLQKDTGQRSLGRSPESGIVSSPPGAVHHRVYPGYRQNGGMQRLNLAAQDGGIAG